jgi:hypothetical protein
MRTYRGWRDGRGDCHVIVHEGHELPRSLDLRLDLDNHSPTGFNWGYGGSGPAQLALALLADALGDDRQAARLHQIFKRSVVVWLKRDAWEMTDEEIKFWAMVKRSLAG